MKKHIWAWVALVVGLVGVGVVREGWAQPEHAKKEEQSSPASTTESHPSTKQENAAPSDSAVPSNSTETEAASNKDSHAPASEVSAETPESKTGEEAVSTATASSQNGLISVDFKDAEIRQVLRIISLKAGVDIVAGTDVEGLVTIKLTNVPWEQALEIILRTYGFTYERKGNIVRVMTIAALEQEALSTEVFPLGYAKAKEVPDIIKEMLSERGRVKFDERTNTIIVTDIPTNLFQIKQVIERLDQRTPQVSIDTKIVETRLQKDENLGIDWSGTIPGTLKQEIPDIVSDFPFKPDGSLGTLGAFFGAQRAPLLGSTQLDSGNRTFKAGKLTTPDVSVVLNLLKTRSNTHIISDPNISVLNNQQAAIHIGQEYPVPAYSIDPTTGRTTVSGYTPKQTGTVLTVTPHVNQNKEIVVDLKPEIVTVETQGVTYSLGGTSGSVTFPIFDSQTAQTQVRIQSGDTIAIGGLVKSNEAKAETKVPLLGDIPVVGLLFKNTRWWSGTSDPIRQDVLIFLTVKLMQEGEFGTSQKVAVAPAAASYR